MKSQSSSRSAFSIVLLTFSLAGLVVLIGFVIVKGTRYVKNNESAVEFTSISRSNNENQAPKTRHNQGQDERAPVPVADNDSDDDVSEGSYDAEDMDYETHLRKIT